MWHASSRSGVATLPTAVDLLLTYTQLGAWLCFPLPVVALCASSWFTQCSGLWCRQHRQVVVSLRGRHHLPTAVFHSATITTRNILQVFVPPVEGFAFYVDRICGKRIETVPCPSDRLSVPAATHAAAVG